MGLCTYRLIPRRASVPGRSRVGVRATAGCAVALAVGSLVLMSGAVRAQSVPADQGQGGQDQGAQDSGSNQTGAPSATSDVTPQGRSWSITPTASVQETITDNAGINSSGTGSTGTSSGTTKQGGDAITSLTAGLDFLEQGSRAQLSGTYSVTQDIYMRNSSDNGFYQNLLTADHVEAVKDRLFIDVRAALDMQPTSSIGQQTSSNRISPFGQQQVFNGSISPSYVEHWGNWAVSTLAYTFSDQAYFSAVSGQDNSTSGQDSIQHRVSLDINNGTRFNQTLWHIGASDNITVGSTASTASSSPNQINIQADGEYRFAGYGFGIPVVVGEDQYSNTGTGESSGGVSGPYVEAGIHWNPGPRTDLRILGGERYKAPYWTGTLKYTITPRLVFNASYDMTVSTPQTALSTNLQDLVVLPNGQIVDSKTGLPLSPNQLAALQTNAVSRTQTAVFGLSGSYGKETVQLGGSAERRQFGGVQPNDASYTLSATVTRQMSPTVNANFSLTADDDQPDSGTASRSVTVSVGVNKQLSEKLNTSLTVSRLQDHGQTNDHEDSVVWALGAKF